MNAESDAAARTRRMTERFTPLNGVDGPAWRPAAELFGAGLDEAVARFGAARGAPTPAVAGSLMLAGYAYRLAGPVLGALHRDGAVLDARLDDVRVELVDGVVRRVGFLRPASPPGPDPLAGLAAQLFGEHLAPVVVRMQEVSRAGTRVLWGNVAASVGSAMLALSWAEADRTRFLATARELLAHEPRAAAVADIRAADVDGESWMVSGRRACCLAFRTEPNRARPDPYCGNCCVLDVGEQLARFRAAARRWRDGPVP